MMIFERPVFTFSISKERRRKRGPYIATCDSSSCFDILKKKKHFLARFQEESRMFLYLTLHSYKGDQKNKEGVLKMRKTWLRCWFFARLNGSI